MICFFANVDAISAQQIVSEEQDRNSFDIKTAVIYVDENDLDLVKRSAELLQSDIEMVTGVKLKIINKIDKPWLDVIAIGSITHSSFIKEMIKRKLLNIAAISGKWEAYRIQSVEVFKEFMPMKRVLAIVGSDRRGTAYGVFELSKQLGVSPWYWWADVPVKKKENVFIKTGIVITDAPKVKYRGIFINDEAPALSNWSKEKFGGFNHLFYEKVFELILRLKGNYLWPAMWGNAFYDDDSLSIRSADKYGIVIGTSHHEPLMRAHDEWKRYGNKQKWNYDSTETGLKNFWKGGMQRAWNEKIVSVGMRGDGDEPMSRETATALLERIVKDQRQIIEEVTGKPASETPQLWALYKEVQDYYDKGMRVPDDVTLLLCDDNWGNIRKLPKPGEKQRKGGYGIYYHFDYVGGPRNYKWVNTNPLPRIWEQMHMAWEYNARQIWIVNVGDIKPMEFPISFFLEYAWNPERIDAADLQKYSEQWAAAQFGDKYAKDIADILTKYAKYNSRRKPELLDANTYSLDNYAEFTNALLDYKDLLYKADKIDRELPASYRDAFFQLIMHPVKACSNLYELYYYTAVNHKLYQQGKTAKVNKIAELVKELYIKDSLITLEYHRLNKGKWNHMMSQTHIGYTYWQQPLVQSMPFARRVPDDSLVNEVVPAPAIQQEHSHSESGTTSLRGLKYNIIERDGHISIAADHFTNSLNTNGITWKILPDHGRTGSAITSFPVTAKRQVPGVTSPHVEYTIFTSSSDSFQLMAYFSPSLNYHNDPEGLQYAISIDDEKPQIVSINKEDKNTGAGVWSKWVSENIIIKTTNHRIKKAGQHTIKYWMVDPGVVLQKLVLDFGGLQRSYLGPPETLKK